MEMFISTCYDIKYDPRGAAAGLVEACLHHKPSDEDGDFIPQIKLPTLVCVARNSNVFDWHGSAWVGEHILGARTVFFEDSGHMLFWEEPEKFNETVTAFIEGIHK